MGCEWLLLYVVQCCVGVYMNIQALSQTLLYVLHQLRSLLHSVLDILLPRPQYTLHKVPLHLAVLFTDQYLAEHNAQFCADLVWYCVLYGVQELTIYDPWSLTLQAQHSITALMQQSIDTHLAHSTHNHAHVTLSVNQPTNKIGADPSRVGIRVQLLGMGDGRDRVCSVLREWAHSGGVSCASVTAHHLSERLQQKGITEPEVLLSVGNTACLMGYPPWALRLTELIQLPPTARCASTGLSEHSFVHCLQTYGNRQQRAGK